MPRVRKSSRWHIIEEAALLRPLYLFPLKSRAFLPGVVGKPSLLLGAWGSYAQDQLTPRPTLEVGALLTLFTLFLLISYLDRQKAGLSLRKLLIKALIPRPKSTTPSRWRRRGQPNHRGLSAPEVYDILALCKGAQSYDY